MKWIPEITDEQNNFLGAIGKLVASCAAIYVFGWGIYEFKIGQGRQYYFELFKHKHETINNLIGYTTYLGNTGHRVVGYDSVYQNFVAFKTTALLEIDDDSLTSSVAIFSNCLELYMRDSKDMTLDDILPYKNDVQRKAQITIHQLTQIDSYEKSDTSVLHSLYGWL